MKYYLAFAAYPGTCKKFQQEWNDGGMDWRSLKEVDAELMMMNRAVKAAADEHEAALDEYFVVMRQTDDIFGEVPFCMT